MKQLLYTSPRHLNTQCFMQLLQNVALRNGNSPANFGDDNKSCSCNKSRLKLNKRLG